MKQKQTKLHGDLYFELWLLVLSLASDMKCAILSQSWAMARSSPMEPPG